MLTKKIFVLHIRQERESQLSNFSFLKKVVLIKQRGGFVLIEFIWLIVFAITLILEICTVQLVSVWFCVGAFFAEIAKLLGCTPIIQFVIFISISCVLLALFYPFVRKSLKKKVSNLNASKVVGKKGKVVQKIDNTSGEGQVKVEGEIWSAKSQSGEIISENETVYVEKIEGVKLIVQKYN